MAKQTTQMVRCRYAKCPKLHESQELRKEDAVTGGKQKYYYHPDCYQMMQTVNQIRDLFIKEINPLLTGQQVGMLVATINNIIFGKNVSAGFLKFAVEYFIKHKPGALKHPQGLHYIIQDKNVIAAWKKKEESEIRAKMREAIQSSAQENNKGEVVGLSWELPENVTVFKQSNKSKFSSVLGV